MSDKYIFDFDDVLFKSTGHFKNHLFKVIAQESGIPEEKINKEYHQDKVREKFSLKDFIGGFLTEGKSHTPVEIVYQEIMSKSLSFVNTEVRQLIQSLGRENCYLVTSGDPEFQKAKVEASGCSMLFKDIKYVVDSKKEAIEGICEENSDAAKIYFIDDKEHHFEGLDRTKYPNLETIDFKTDEFDEFKAQIKEKQRLGKEAAQESTKLLNEALKDSKKRN